MNDAHCWDPMKIEDTASLSILKWVPARCMCLRAIISPFFFMKNQLMKISEQLRFIIELYATANRDYQIKVTT